MDADTGTMRLGDCCNFYDFRALAKRRLPAPIFDYIDGAADDEVTLRQNAASFERCDLVPNVLRGVGAIDLSVTVMGQKLAMPVYCSPTALQRLFHHDGERAVAAAASKFGTMFGVSSLGTVSLEELRKAYDTPQVYQFYFHKDRALNRVMMQRAKDAGIDIEKELNARTLGPWYKSIGQGMGAALNTAGAGNAYVLSDRGTWIHFKNKGDLQILVEGDKHMFNQYGVMLVNPEKHPNVKKNLGQQFIDWLVSAEGQKAIANYKIDGQQLFYPNANDPSA